MAGQVPGDNLLVHEFGDHDVGHAGYSVGSLMPLRRGG